MPINIQSPPAYMRLHHHPLASAFLAIFAATLLVVGVQGYTSWTSDVVLAGDAGDAVEEVEDAPLGAEQLDAH